jgi:TPR repeat protein
MKFYFKLQTFISSNLSLEFNTCLFQALKQHENYCNMNHYLSHNSCYKAGLLLRQSQEITNIPQNFESAFQYFRKGCSSGNAFACYELGLAYESGRGVAKDLKLAEEFKKKAEGMPISSNSLI